MMALVIGGSGSGKSVFAEELACSLSAQRVYAATMAATGAEAHARIARHRAQRAGKGFVTHECVGAIAPELLGAPTQMAAPAPHATNDVVLLDDLGNLVANALFDAKGQMGDPTSTLERLHTELERLCSYHRHVVLVCDEAGCAGRSAYEAANVWLRLCGTLACRMAARADAVVEVACGVPHVLKGVLP